jgi:hypothetical protein
MTRLGRRVSAAKGEFHAENEQHEEEKRKRRLSQAAGSESHTDRHVTGTKRVARLDPQMGLRLPNPA